VHGPNGSLKERAIGIDLFNLAEDFDPSQHTIVRVTANEVRKRLAQHYLAEIGTPHAVRIKLPPGSYKTEFRRDTVAVAPAAELSPPQPPSPEELPVEEMPTTKPPDASHPGRLRFVVVASVVILAAIAVLSGSRWNPTTRVSTEGARSLGSSAASATAADDDLRMIMGATATYVDRSGRTWTPDRFFAGGAVAVRPSEKIVRTLDPDIYRHLRQGDFKYDIPLKPGSYELHLHFAETGLADFISAESSGEGQRLFRVTVNGNRILTAFDVVADANGASVSDERVFRNISPAPDGLLHLSFESLRGIAMLSGIEVLPVVNGKVRPVRIRAGWTSAWRDSAGQEWKSDSYFLGGNALVRNTNPAQGNNSIAPDMALYASERWGHFSYAVPVADGRYRVTLKFCEGHYGKRNTGVGGVGSRIFDVYCNGVALLRGFDIAREAGGEARPFDKAFSGIRPNAQGKIVLSFVPTTGMACLNGIEVIED
jgi:hypothetical protein